jgi:hypothetical protein
MFPVILLALRGFYTVNLLTFLAFYYTSACQFCPVSCARDSYARDSLVTGVQGFLSRTLPKKESAIFKARLA